MERCSATMKTLLARLHCWDQPHVSPCWLAAMEGPCCWFICFAFPHRPYLVGGFKHVFPYIGNNDPNKYFSEGWNHQPVMIPINFAWQEFLAIWLCALPHIVPDQILQPTNHTRFIPFHIHTQWLQIPRDFWQVLAMQDDGHLATSQNPRTQTVP